MTATDDRPNQMVLLDELRRVYGFNPGDQLGRMDGFPDVEITLWHVDAEHDHIVITTTIHASRGDVVGILDNAG